MPIAFRFGAFTLNPREGVLYRGGVPLALTPKAIQVLTVLVSERGTLVEKRTLLERVWPEIFVEEATLAQNIFTLRKTLGQQEDGRPFIETVPRRGYRFAAPVIVVNGEPPPEPRRPSRRRPVLFATLLIATIGLAGLVLARNGAAPRFRPHSYSTLAVLPFKSADAQPDDYLGAAMAEAVARRISRHPELIVRPPDAVRRAVSPGSDPVAAGQKLQVEVVMEGEVQQEDGRTRLSVRLLRVRDRQVLWRQSFDTNARDFEWLRDAVVVQASSVLRAGSAAPADLFPRRYTADRVAYHEYLKGRYFWYKRTDADYERAIAHFQEALRHDPNLAPAYAGMADTYLLLSTTVSRKHTRAEAANMAQGAARKAIELDEDLAEAHASLGFIRLHYFYDWWAAEKEFTLALRLNPGYATAHHWYAYWLVLVGRKEEAIQHMRRALEIDPLSPLFNGDLSEFLFYAGRYDESIEQAKRTLELDPSFVHAYRNLSWAYRKKGMHHEAIAAARKCQELRTDGSLLTELILSYVEAGRMREARAAFAELRRRHARAKSGLSYSMAVAHTAFGDDERALEMLERAADERSGSLIVMHVEGFFDRLANHPRYRALRQRLGLPDSESSTLTSAQPSR